jgi:hypothetical protein
MTNVRLALVSAESIVENVIEIPGGNGPEFATEILGLPGNWIVDEFVEAGPGALFDPETGNFYSPEPEQTPEEPLVEAPQEPTP